VKRREFITVLGGAAAAWPLAARAQQPAKVRRVGMLIGYAENDPETQARLLAFRQGLDHLGWKEGSSVVIDYRFAPASPDQAQHFAKELVALRPDVLVGNSTPATAALLRETRTIPIVFVGVSDPLGSGFVASIARPGGNTTGFTNFESSLTGKWLEMGYPQSTLTVTRPSMAACFPMASTPSICFGERHPMLIASSRARSRPIFPCKRRPSSSWLSISEPPGRSG